MSAFRESLRGYGPSGIVATFVTLAGIAISLWATTAPARAEIETIVVTAELRMSAKAMALDKAIGLRLTPSGKAFVAQQTTLLNSGALQPSGVAARASRICKRAFDLCRPGDETQLAYFVLASSYSDWQGFYSGSGINEATFAKASEHIQPYLLRNDIAGSRKALLSSLPPKPRALLIAYQARKDKVWRAMCTTLKALGIPDGCVYKPSH